MGWGVSKVDGGRAGHRWEGSLFIEHYISGDFMRLKKSSTGGQIQTWAAIKRQIEPVRELTEVEHGYFVRIVQTREADTWQPHDVSLATQLATAMAQLDAADAVLAREGFVTPDGRKHPAMAAKATVSGAVVSLTRLLGLSASQKGLGTQAQRARNQSELKTRQIFEQTGGGGLIPGLDSDGLI